jgi:hypothetical protein
MSRAPLEHGLYKEALLNLQAAILLDNPEEKLSLKDRDGSWLRSRRCFTGPWLQDTHITKPTG